MKITGMDLEKEEEGEFEPAGPQGPMPRLIARGLGAQAACAACQIAGENGTACAGAEAGIAPGSADNGGDGNG